MTQFVKKPIPIEAIRWEGNNLKAVKHWMFDQVVRNLDKYPVNDSDTTQAVDYANFVKRRGSGMTEELWKNIADEDWGPDISAAIYDYLHETYVGVKDGQWIMCGTEGEFYPCADDGTGNAPLNYERTTPDA